MKCPHCGKALAVIASERFGSVTAHESPLCARAQELQAPGLVAIHFVFVGFVPAQGPPRCEVLLGEFRCALAARHRGMHRAEEK